MLADYGLLTNDMSEKNVVKVLDQKLDTYFREVADKNYGMSITLYPNINEAGEQKFKTPGVVWNLLINDVPMCFNGITFLKRTNPDLPRFVEYLLKDLPFEVVVNYRYAEGEERV